VVPETVLLPNAAAILRDLSYMTSRWHELAIPVVMEIRAFKEHCQPQIGKFSPGWLDEAVEWVENMNAKGYNLYAVRNPIRHDVKGSASDGDIVASFFLWADFDEPSSADNVRRWEGPKYSAAVTTGRIPGTRVHTYWQLAEPCTDMALWRDTQVAIAAQFGSDATVINPSRIMRIGGTISYPAKHKQERGYTQELTTIRTEYDDDRQPVTLDQMRRAFNATPPAKPAQPAPGLHIDTGAFQTLDRERAAIQAMSGQEWNTSVLRLVGSYVRKGLSNTEIHALTDPLTLAGYTVDQTRAEVQNMIDRTRANPKFADGSDATPNFDFPPAGASADAPATWKIQSAADFTADFVAPEYIVDGVIRRGMIYTFTAPTGSGKTAVMLYAATAVATGNAFVEREVEHGDVLFLAGENPDDVRARVIATMEFYGISADDCRLHFIAGTFSIRSDLEILRREAAKLPNLVMVVVDTFAAYFEGDDENSNAQALDFARLVRKIAAFPSKPSVVMPAHPVKNATRQNLSPKGGSSLMNEVDGNLTLWNDGGILSMHWQGKYRGAEFEPMQFELEKYQCDRLKDSKGRLMPTILAKPMLQTRAIQIAQENLSFENKAILSIYSKPELSIADRCVDIGLRLANGEVYKSKMDRIIKKLEGKKMIRRFHTGWELTGDGERVVELIKSGRKFAPETGA